MDRLGELANVLSLQGAGLRDLFDVRKVLEVQGAEWAAQRRSAHHVERLRSIVDDAYRHSDDLNVMSEGDAQFHVAVAEASQNLVLVRVMFTLLDLLEAARRESLSIPGRPEALPLPARERAPGDRGAQPGGGPSGHVRAPDLCGAGHHVPGENGAGGCGLRVLVTELIWPEGLAELETFGEVEYDPEPMAEA